MTYAITPDFDHKTIRIVVSGTMHAKGSLDMGLEAVRQARELGWRKFLVDMRTSSVKDSTIETYQHMDHFQESGYLRTDFIAAVYQHDEERHRFAEDVVRNRGWSGVRYFKKLEDAESWLVEREV